jgi:hypothetical protein
MAKTNPYLISYCSSPMPQDGGIPSIFNVGQVQSIAFGCLFDLCACYHCSLHIFPSIMRVVMAPRASIATSSRPEWNDAKYVNTEDGSVKKMDSTAHAGRAITVANSSMAVQRK